MIRSLASLTAVGLCLMAATAARADEPLCGRLDRLYPEPGRSGLPGDNAFRPLPELTPQRAQPGAPGTLSMSLSADHVSQAPAGRPGYVYVGNYPVTNIPVFRIIHGTSTTFDVKDPNTGRMAPISDACATSPDWGFGGTQWNLVQGDTLDVMFRSKLDYNGPNELPNPTNGAVPCDSSSLHTHGLLVSPYHPAKAGQGPQGDYVLDVTMPHPNPDWGTGYDTCGTELGMVEKHKHGLTTLPLHYVIDIPGKPGQSGLRSGEHPSGLFWYHPHAHGFAKIQVHGGTTGAITIGSLTDYACPAGDGTPGHCNLSNTNVRVMALKDTELQSYGAGGLWSTVLDPESSYCTNTGGIRDGECQATDANSPGKWVFTINGIQYPTIRPGAGKTEIWRLINASNGLSYVLDLQGTGANKDQQLPFQVLSEDGVSILQGSNSPFVRTRILMMPSSRVEIAIAPPPGGGTYILHNQAVETGAKGSGDMWPDVNLAKIVWDKPDAQAPAAPSGPIQVAGPDLPFHNPRAVDVDESQIPESCRFKAGDTRVVYFTHRFNSVLGPKLLPPSGESAKEIFGLITGIRHADGTMDFFNSDHPEKKLHEIKQVWLAGVNGEDGADPDFPAFMHNPWSTICAVKGSNEPWELQNWTGEDHNFHIHQGKFTINPNGVFQYPIPEPIYPQDLLLGDEMVKDFVDLSNPTYNDNIPVPRGQSFCDVEKHQPGCKKQSLTDNRECTGEPGAKRCANPGIVSIIMDFSRYEQVGSYVYHCHILEHEDGGMMAQINVICPPNDTKCAANQMVKAPICKPGDQANASPAGEVLDTAIKTLKTGSDTRGISN